MKHTFRNAAGIFGGVAMLFAVAAWAEPQASAPAPVTRSLQQHPPGDDPRVHAFYDTLLAARARGAEKVDTALEQKLREMARGYTPLHDLDVKTWEDHVVDMGRQMLEIGGRDPKIFESYDNFVIALRGPQ